MKHIKLYEQQNNGAYFGGQDGEIYSIRRTWNTFDTHYIT